VAYFEIGSHDASNLLGRAGFKLLTVDVDEVKVVYPSIWELVSDLRDMGENNAVLGRHVHPVNVV
jgi:NADH dehydrogenase [ubiquinone] 1 alpha subcomplex assembly factor 5